jgi:hypothetical protein
MKIPKRPNMKLTNEALISLQIGLGRLGDGEDDCPVGDKLAKRLYRLGGDVRFKIAKAQNAVDQAVKVYQTAQRALFKEIAGADAEKIEALSNGISQGVQPSAADAPLVDKLRRFNEAHAELLKAETELAVDPITWNDLKVGPAPDGNEIPNSIIRLCAPAIEGI